MKLFLLEEIYFVKIDDADGERIEYRISDGFWADKNKLEAAKKSIEKSLASGWELSVTEFDVAICKKQKYLYVLNHEYMLQDGTCYYYQFYPQTSRKKCNELKEKLAKESKYEIKDNRIYDKKTKGWFVEKYEIIL